MYKLQQAINTMKLVRGSVQALKVCCAVLSLSPMCAEGGQACHALRGLLNMQAAWSEVSHEAAFIRVCERCCVRAGI